MRQNTESLSAWEHSRLTTEEAEKALTAAGIPVDPRNWTEGNFYRASIVLDAAVANKRGTQS